MDQSMIGEYLPILLQCVTIAYLLKLENRITKLETKIEFLSNK